ncbi:MAG: hypothetical protein IJ971_11125 [Bacteroidales bacterium]|nr:hypothetical protein [Bacteroidales bacterium]
MKGIINTLLCTSALLLAASCLQEEMIVEMPVNESIILDLSSGATKAEQTSTEAYVNQLDVFIFDVTAGKPDVLITHETFSVNNASQVTLDAKRTDFGENQEYFVYLLANSTLEFSGVDNFSDLNDLKQEDELLHLTGLDVPDAPRYFLMDAVAEDSEGNSPVILYNGKPEENTELNALLERAAAKIVISITASENISFRNYGIEDGSEGGLFYVRNLPYDTWVLSGTQAATDLQNVLLRTTAKTDTEYFTWNPEFEAGDKNVTLTTYVYPHHWDNASILDKETCAVLNLPLDYKVSENETIPYHNSWYKVPMTDNATFERNNIYQIDITLDRPGASEESEPIILDEIHYTVEDWTGVDVVVSGEDKPNYLQLNTDHVNMYNVNIDDSTLKFASSSEISSVTLDEAYYINYLGNKVDVSNLGISASAETEVLNGNITINSPFVSMSDAEKQEAIAALYKPVFNLSEPVEPEGKPTPPEEVENPGDEQPDDPRNEATWNTIAEKHSSEGFLFWPSVTVTYTIGSDGNPVFTDNRDWSEASVEAQAEYDRLLDNFLNYMALKEKYDTYLKEYAEYETLLEAWEQENSSYVSELSAYYAALETYEIELKEYNDAVAEINRSDEDTHENAIRYMTFTVENITGQEATFTVAQYPTIYITHEMGHYSYRSDFGGTDYNQAGNPNRSGANWSNGRWTYGSEASGSYFFGSKVRTGSEGNYDINYVYWSNNGRRTQDINGLDNPRMYHVHVTATSSEYTVGIPRLDADGYTESTAENTKLVSPSFMIASQLGATMTPNGGINQARSHCEQYVEVTDNGTIYDDWRLPTAAEIDIIIQHQDISDAMAVVLTGTAYYCAYNGMDNNGNVIYTKATGKTGGQNAVRCIRDNY